MRKILITSLFLSLIGTLFICSRQQQDMLEVLIPQEEIAPRRSQTKADTLSYTQPMYPSVIH